MNAWSFTPALPIRLHGTLPSNNKLFHAMSERIGEGTIAPANPPKVYKDVEVQHHSFLSSELHGGDRWASRPIRCIPGTHLTADPTASRNATQNSALTVQQLSHCTDRYIAASREVVVADFSFFLFEWIKRKHFTQVQVSSGTDRSPSPTCWPHLATRRTGAEDRHI